MATRKRDAINLGVVAHVEREVVVEDNALDVPRCAELRAQLQQFFSPILIGLLRQPFEQRNHHRCKLLLRANGIANQSATLKHRVRVEHTLDLVGIERAFRRVHDVIGAAAEPEVALGVEVADVAHAVEEARCRVGSR